MRSNNYSIYMMVLLLLSTITSIHAAVPYERMSSVRIIKQQTACEEMMAHRSKKRIIAATGTGIIAATGISLLMYNWLKPNETTASPLPATAESEAKIKEAQARALDELANNYQRLSTPKGYMLAKLQDFVALGLATAVISFIISRSSNLLDRATPLLDSILPLSDIPLLVMALRRAVAGGRHYERSMLLLLAQPTRAGSLAHDIAEKTKRFEHSQLVATLEQLSAWLSCFTNEMGEIGYQEAQATLGSLMQVTNNLATLYENGDENHSNEIRELIGTLHMQTERLAVLIIPVLRELGYEQE